MPADLNTRDAGRALLQLDRAEHNLAVLARLARTVWATKDAEPDIYHAARETYNDAALRLTHNEAISALKLAAFVVGRVAAAGYTTPTTPEGN
jgi:hypothetical protein